MVPEPRILLFLLLLVAWAGKWTALFFSPQCSPSTKPTIGSSGKYTANIKVVVGTRFLPTIRSDCCDPSWALNGTYRAVWKPNPISTVAFLNVKNVQFFFAS